MTHRDIQWNKLDDFIEQSKEKVNDFKRLEEIENEKIELHKKVIATLKVELTKES